MSRPVESTAAPGANPAAPHRPARNEPAIGPTAGRDPDDEQGRPAPQQPHDSGYGPADLPDAPAARGAHSASTAGPTPEADPSSDHQR